MHVRLQKHYKKQAFVCLDISVLAAFRVAQQNNYGGEVLLNVLRCQLTY